MKYKKETDHFPLLLHFYYDVCEIGDVEVKKTGKIYFKDFPIKSGLGIKSIQKVLKIANKELRKQKRKDWFNYWFK